MKTPTKVWFAVRALRFKPSDAEQIAKLYKQYAESEQHFSPATIARFVCARTGLHPEIWHEPLTRAFAESSKEMMYS